jgi:pyruvate formate lyase activating enzyme
MSPDIYKAYTGKDNARVKRNLEWLSKAGRASDCTIRVPIIPGYNSAECVDDSISQLKAMGFGNFDKFVYVTDRSKK